MYFYINNLTFNCTPNEAEGDEMIYPKFYNQEATGAKPKLEINFEKQNPV